MVATVYRTEDFQVFATLEEAVTHEFDLKTQEELARWLSGQDFTISDLAKFLYDNRGTVIALLTPESHEDEDKDEDEDSNPDSEETF